MAKWPVGEVSITKVVELEVTGGSRFILPQATPEAVLPLGCCNRISRTSAAA